MDQKQLEQLDKDLDRHEGGHRLTAYLDTQGVWTMGLGHTGPEVKEGMVITMEKSEELYEVDRAEAIRDAKRYLGGIELDPVRFGVIVNMAFNLGLPKLTGFRRLRQAITEKNWYGAYMAMLESRWTQQVKRRAFELSARMLIGVIQREHQV